MSVHPYIVTALSTFMLYENSSHLHQLCTLGILKNVSNISGLHLFLELEATGALQLKPYHSSTLQTERNVTKFMPPIYFFEHFKSNENE